MDIHARISYGQITQEEGERILNGEKYPRAELNAPIPKSDEYTVTMTTRYSQKSPHDTENNLGKIRKISHSVRHTQRWTT